MSKHTFISTPDGPNKEVGKSWTYSCDICGKPVVHPNHNVSDEKGFRTLLDLLEEEDD